LDHGPVASHLGQHAGETGIAVVAAGELRLAVLDHAERAGVDDAIDELASAIRAEQAGLIVVGLGGHEGVLSREIEETLVAFEFFVAENAEGGVARAVALDDSSGAVAEDFALGLDTIAFRKEAAILALSVIEFLESSVDGHEIVVHD